MGDENPPRTLGDYSRPTNKGYQNTIELPEGNNVVPLRSDTICMDLFQGLNSKSPSSWHRSLAPSTNILRPHHHTLKRVVDYAAGRRLREISAKEAWSTIEELVQYEEEGWDNLIFLEKGSLNYENTNMEQILESMECHVDSLMKNEISLVGKSENLCGLMNNEAGYLSLEPPHQEAFEGLVINFILDQEEKVPQLVECMRIIRNDFMQLSLEFVERLREEIKMKEHNQIKKIQKIMKYPNTESSDSHE
ncbi:hypothetical protein Tco_0849886 [Tanacetum coccineum]